MNDASFRKTLTLDRQVLSAKRPNESCSRSKVLPENFRSRDCKTEGKAAIIEHIVLLKLKADTTEQQIQTLADALLKMAEKIPGIEEISMGINNSPGGKNHDFTYGFIVHFRDEAARGGYLPHPVHRQVAGEYLRPIVDDVSVFGYTHTPA